MRGKQAPRRKLLPDPKYGSTTIAKLINMIMERGKKTIAQKIVYGAFDLMKKRTKKDPLDVFDKALKNIRPLLEVKARRIGGANYQVPIEVRADRKNTLAFRWLLAAARSRKGIPMSKKLAFELIDASNKTGAAVKKKEDVHRMAESNRAFARFA